MEMRSEFGTRLFEARRRAGLTQTQVAKAVGISQGTYAELEKVGTGSSKTAQIAEVCGVVPRWLATGEGMMVFSGGLLAEEKPAQLVEVLSPSALEIAHLYDLIPASDRVRRARAYNAATAAILDVLQETPSTAAEGLLSQKQSV